MFSYVSEVSHTSPTIKRLHSPIHKGKIQGRESTTTTCRSFRQVIYSLLCFLPSTRARFYGTFRDVLYFYSTSIIRPSPLVRDCDRDHRGLTPGYLITSTSSTISRAPANMTSESSIRPKVECVIFDVDGTSIQCHLQAFILISPSKV